MILYPSYWPDCSSLSWIWWEPMESMRVIRERYWSHLKAQRREAAFPTSQMPRCGRRLRPVRSVRHSTLGSSGCARVRFQRKRRQIVKTHLRSIFP